MSYPYFSSFFFRDFGGDGQFFHHHRKDPRSFAEKSCCRTQICSHWRIVELWHQISSTWILLTKMMMVGCGSLSDVVLSGVFIIHVNEFPNTWPCNPGTSRLRLSLKHFIFLLTHQEVLILLRPTCNKGHTVSPFFISNHYFGGYFRHL